jgi:hypothetical protein
LAEASAIRQPGAANEDLRADRAAHTRRLDEITTGAHDAAIQTQEKQYKGYVIAWIEPPVSPSEWVLNVSHNVRGKLSRMAVITAPTFQQAMDKAEKFIDGQAAAHPASIYDLK